MLDIEVFARKIQSRHALFVFDSCFAGTIFEVMRSGQVPEYVSDSTARPVRQFITSGEAGEEVPDRSRFARVFVEALRGEVPEGDGYLTGRELGQHLYKVVSEQTRGAQHPQHGKLLDEVLGRGDFVFELPRQPVAPPPDTDVLDLEDLKRRGEREAAEAEWQSWQARMLQDFREVEEFEGSNVSPLLKAQAWERFQASYEADNPYSEEDDASRRRAAAREAHWRSLGAAAEELPPPPPPVLRPGAEMPEPPLPGMSFRYIPPGTFQMGSPDDEPGRDSDETRHSVTLTRGYWMGETEVTQAQWQAVMDNNPSYFQNCGAACPVEQVTWFDAVVFANALSRKARLDECYELTGCTGAPQKCDSVTFRGLDCRGYRLPTEAEWERAARSGTDTAIYTGNLTLRGRNNGPELDPIAWYGGNSGVTYSGGLGCSSWPEKQKAADTCGTHPAGEKAANSWGLRDMLGNVWEWTSDWSAGIENAAVRDPLGPEEGSYRVQRGGSWFINARNCRAANRYFGSPGYRVSFVGFRLVRTAP